MSLPKIFGLYIIALFVLTYGFGWAFNFPGGFWIYNLIVTPIISIPVAWAYLWAMHKRYPGEAGKP